MEKKKIQLLAAVVVILLAASAATAYYVLSTHKPPTPQVIRVACVGDSLTQSNNYTVDLWHLLGSGGPYIISDYTIEPAGNVGDGARYSVGNFGAGGTTVLLTTDTPYMDAVDSKINKSVLQSALDFEPDIVIIMLGTNDAQPGLKPYNASFVGDYVTLISTFQALPSKPKIWVVLPPQILSSETQKIDGAYFASTLIPDIAQAANQTNVSTIDVFSVLNSPDYFKTDGEHLNDLGAQLVANTVYKAITHQKT